jgi:hypothetical protein
MAKEETVCVCERVKGGFYMLIRVFQKDGTSKVVWSGPVHTIIENDKL